MLVERRNGDWQALVGLPLSAQPGEHTIRVVSAGAGGVQERGAGFRVLPHAYATQRLTIKDVSKVTPPPEALARIEQEALKMASLRTRFRDSAGVDTDFVLPAKGRLSSRFGLRRDSQRRTAQSARRPRPGDTGRHPGAHPGSRGGDGGK